MTQPELQPGSGLAANAQALEEAAGTPPERRGINYAAALERDPSGKINRRGAPSRVGSARQDGDTLSASRCSSLQPSRCSTCSASLNPGGTLVTANSLFSSFDLGSYVELFN